MPSQNRRVRSGSGGRKIRARTRLSGEERRQQISNPAARRRDDAGRLRALAREMVSRIQAGPTLLRPLLFRALEGQTLPANFFRSGFHRVDGFLRRSMADRMAAGTFREVEPTLATWSFIGMIACHVVHREIFGQKAPARLTTDRATEAMVEPFLDRVRRCR